jgi:uncharacterized SAM-binding protein YcdF (DUF218 family)
MIAKGLLLSLAMPPTGLLTALVIGLLLSGRRLRLGLVIAWAGVAGLVLLAMPVVSQNLLLALETGLPTVPPADHPPGAIVVLGAEVIRAHGEPDGGRPGLLTLDRLRTAAELARRTGLPILVSGGLIQPDEPAVGQVMADSLRGDFRVPVRWVEDRSRDTWENARLSAAILHDAGISSVYVVTSSWHMRRALLSFQGTGLTVTAAPTPLFEPLAPQWGDFVPQASAWQTAYYALHEWIGYAWYKAR